MASGAATRSAKSRRTACAAASLPPSQTMAPSTASRASARVETRLAPPDLRSPSPRFKKRPSSSRRAASASAVALTRLARISVSSCWLASGCASNSMRATTKPSTASPRNSKRSKLSAPALLWVSARFSRLRLPKRWPSFSSSCPSARPGIGLHACRVMRSCLAPATVSVRCAAPRGMHPAESPRGPAASSASCLPSAFRGASSCASRRRRSTSR